MRVLVTGGRDNWDWDALFAILDTMPITRIIVGDAKGIDSGAQMWAFCRGIPYEEYKAKWHKYDRAAGVKRNALMLTMGQPEVVVAFPGGPGTADMVQRARKAGVLTLEYTRVYKTEIVDVAGLVD